MFDFIYIQALPEKIARFFLHELISVIEHIHESGFCHRDIKLENILLDHEFKPILADFSFATELAGYSLRKYCGTETYMAPEQHLKLFYDGEKVDIFALGVVLFMTLTGKPPFRCSKRSDPYYKCLSGNQRRRNIFWKKHSEICG